MELEEAGDDRLERKGEVGGEGIAIRKVISTCPGCPSGFSSVVAKSEFEEVEEIDFEIDWRDGEVENWDLGSWWYVTDTG